MNWFKKARWLTFVGLMLLPTLASAVVVDISSEDLPVEQYRRIYSGSAPALSPVGRILMLTQSGSQTTHTTYTQITAIADTTTTGSHSGRLRFSVAKQGALQDTVDITTSGLKVLNGTLSADTITATGNVGIGTTSPSSTLSVAGTGSTDPLTVTNSAGTPVLKVASNGNIGIGAGARTDWSALYVQGPSFGGGHSLATRGDLGFGVSAAYGVGVWFGSAGSYATGNHIRQTAANTLVFYPGGTNNGPALTIKPNAIGIGTSTPASGIDVRTAAVTDGALKYSAVVADTAEYNASPLSGINLYAKYTSGGAYAGMGGIAAGKENTTDGNYASYLALYTRANGSTPAERLRINSSGNVGIGTNNPGAKLDVSGNGRFGTTSNNQITLNTSDAGNGAWLRNDGNHTVFSTWVGNMYLGYGGNTSKVIHIGNSSPGVVQVAGNAPTGSLVVNNSYRTGLYTTTPYYPLDIVRPFELTYSGDSDSGMQFTSAFRIKSNMPCIEFTDNQVDSGQTSSQDFVLGVQDGKFYITSESWTASHFVMTQQGTLTLDYQLLPSAHFTTTPVDIGASGRAFDDVYGDDFINQGALDFSNIKVLDVLRAHPPAPKPKGSFDATKREFTAANSNDQELDPGSLPIELTDYHSTSLEYTENTDPVWVKANRLLVDEMTSATRTRTDLQVEEFIREYKKYHKDPATMTPQELGISLGQMSSFNYAVGYELAMGLEDVQQNLVTLPDNVAAPDFVFEPDYVLMDLDALKAYLLREKHLPEVPSRVEIEGGKVNRDTLQMNMLQKIEELALYAIEQHEAAKGYQQQAEQLGNEQARLASELNSVRAENKSLQSLTEQTKADQQQMRTEMDAMRKETEALRAQVQTMMQAIDTTKP